MPKNIISASVLNTDLSEFGKTAQKIDENGVEWLHFDVMDGEFVENITFGSAVLASVAPHTKALKDVHLMVAHPQRQVKLFADAGAQMITFHAESDCNPSEVIKAIKDCGVMAGIAVKPKTPVSEIMPYIADCDMVLVMTVEPGYGGQGFMPETLGKIKEIRAAFPDKNIQVDGGINDRTAVLVKEAGANVLVSGTYLFRAEDMRKTAELLRA